MSRITRALEILEALNQHFQEHDGQIVLYSDSQILDDNTSIKDAIAECLGSEDEPEEPIVPRSQRRKIARNIHNHWNGYIGKHKVESFKLDYEAALKWVHAGPTIGEVVGA